MSFQKTLCGLGAECAVQLRRGPRPRERVGPSCCREADAPSHGGDALGTVPQLIDKDGTRPDPGPVKETDPRCPGDVVRNGKRGSEWVTECRETAELEDA